MVLYHVKCDKDEIQEILVMPSNMQYTPKCTGLTCDLQHRHRSPIPQKYFQPPWHGGSTQGPRYCTMAEQVFVLTLWSALHFGTPPCCAFLIPSEKTALEIGSHRCYSLQGCSSGRGSKTFSVQRMWSLSWDTGSRRMFASERNMNKNQGEGKYFYQEEWVERPETEVMPRKKT